MALLVYREVVYHKLVEKSTSLRKFMAISNILWLLSRILGEFFLIFHNREKYENGDKRE